MYLSHLFCDEMLMLELHVLSYSGDEPKVPLSVIFLNGYGTIGRSPENTLVLPDPERHVSRIQASIKTVSQGRYEIENVSSANPVFVGSVEVESRAKIHFRVGDELRIGLYVIGSREVAVKQRKENYADLQPKPANSARDPMSDPLAASIPLDFDLFALPSAASRNSANPLEELNRSNVVSLRGMMEQTTTVDGLIDAGPPTPGQTRENPLFDSSPSGIGQAPCLDPLQLFGGLGAPVLSSVFGNGSGAPASNHASELASFLNLPKPQSNVFKAYPSTSNRLDYPGPKGADPYPHYADTRTETAVTKTSQTTALISGFDQPFPPAFPPNTTHEPVRRAVDERMIATGPLEIASKDPQATAAFAAERLGMPSVAGENEIQDLRAVGNDGQASSSTKAALLKALLEGAGVPDLDFPQELDEAFMRKIGMLLQVSVNGAVDMMQARAVTKRELRADVTMIVSSGNNPLKFAPDGQAAMIQLLGRPFRGFMPPVDAVKDAFDDLRAHQIGVIVGTRAALRDVFQRFNPEQLDGKLAAPTAVQTLMPSVRKAKLWALYTEMFGHIAAEAEDDFQALFGKAFRSAYDAEVDNLKRSRHE
jgi:FHA domain-containing protein